MFDTCWPRRGRLNKSGRRLASSSNVEQENAGCSTSRTQQLWSYFYCIVLCLIQTLLVYRAALTISENMSNSYLSTELYAYTVAVALSITTSFLAVIASLVKLGNFANDGDKLGKVVVRIQKNKPVNANFESGAGDGAGSSKMPLWRRCWQRAAPFAPTCHLIAAFLLLIPKNILVAKSLAQGLNAELATATEIDVFMRRKTTRLDLYLLLTLGPNTNVTAPEKTLPPSFILGSDRPSALILPSAEWANYILAAVLFASRYPAVFWYTNKSIGLFFVFQQFVSIINYATSHAGFSLLFNLSSMANLVPFDFLLHPVAVFLLYICSLMVVLASSMIVFEYGYEQYLKQIRTYQRIVRHTSSVSQHAMVVSANGRQHESELADSVHESSGVMPTAYSWRSYCSNIAAVVALICLTASKVPLVYDYMTIYRLSEDTLVFVCLISDAVYFFYWIMIWFVFTLKQNWTFLIQHPFIHFRDVAIDGTDGARANLLTTSNVYHQQNATSGLTQENSGSMLTTSHAKRQHHPSSGLSRTSSPTRSLMDLANLTGPLAPGYNQHQPRLSRPLSALVNAHPHAASGLTSPSMPNCKAEQNHHAPTTSSTMHVYRQSFRDKTTGQFYRGGGTLGSSGQSGNYSGLAAADPKRRSLQAKHFSALNGFALQSGKLNGMACNGSLGENVDKQSLNGWAITTSGTATDIIPEDAPVDSFKPHVPLKLSASSTSYQLDQNGYLSRPPTTSTLHESRSEFVLMNARAANGHLPYTVNSNGGMTTASFASIPSIIKKRPAPPPRHLFVTPDSNNSNSPNEAESGAGTMTTSNASQV